jgi:hypothetical protein
LLPHAHDQCGISEGKIFHHITLRPRIY